MNSTIKNEMEKIITVKYFKTINSSYKYKTKNMKEEFINLQVEKEVAEQLGGYTHLKNIEALNVTGKSMEPLIKDQSLVFIDRSKTALSFEKENIYVVNISSEICIKKVRYIPTYNKIELTSANKLYSPELYELEDVTIIGKVVGTTSDEYQKVAA